MDDSKQHRSPMMGTETGGGNTGNSGSLPSYRSASLFAGANRLLISHDGDIYQLRITRNRKLILTK